MSGMKKLNYLWMMLFAMVMSVGLAACEEDDEKVDAPQELFGSWNCYGETVTFYSDGRAVWTYSDGETDTASYTYDAGSGTIIITAYGETVRWHIVSLTSTSLTIEDEEGYPMTMERVGSSGATDDDDENVAPGGPSGEEDSDFDMSAPSTLLPVADLYPEVSGKYEVSNAESGISSIELLGDGHYLLQKASASYYMMKKAPGKNGRLRGVMASAVKRDYMADESLVFGGFTKVEDGLFELEGYGTLKVTGRDSVGNIVDFVLTDNSGLTIPLTVDRLPPVGGWTEATDRICRSWDVAKARSIMYMDSTKVLDATYWVGDDYVAVATNLLGIDVEDEELFDTGGGATTSARFSPDGTYMMFFRDGTMDVSNWRWEDEANGLIYSYDLYNGMEDGIVGQAAFSDDKMTITTQAGYSMGYSWVSETYIELCRALN